MHHVAATQIEPCVHTYSVLQVLRLNNLISTYSYCSAAVCTAYISACIGTCILSHEYSGLSLLWTSLG